jgi:hypothetical protein
MQKVIIIKEENAMASIRFFDINKLLNNLHNERHLFANEFDLQVSLCLEIRKEFADSPNIHVVPEFTYLGEDLDEDSLASETNEKKNYCDIVVYDEKSNNEAVVIELKYKVTTDYERKKAFEKRISPVHPKGTLDLNTYYLSNQDASDDGSLLFLEDMYRIEHIISYNTDKTGKYQLPPHGPRLTAIKGYCILITDDSGYWKSSREDSKGSKTRIMHLGGAKEAKVGGYKMNDKNYSFYTNLEMPLNDFVWHEYSRVNYLDSRPNHRNSHDLFGILVLEYVKDSAANPTTLKSVELKDLPILKTKQDSTKQSK